MDLREPGAVVASGLLLVALRAPRVGAPDLAEGVVGGAIPGLLSRSALDRVYVAHVSVCVRVCICDCMCYGEVVKRIRLGKEVKVGMSCKVGQE